MRRAPLFFSRLRHCVWPWLQVENLGDGVFLHKPTYGAQLSYFLAKEVKEPGQLVMTLAGPCGEDDEGRHAGGRGEKPPSG